jgi:CubicO group peptidase (beta-lactamase class C family)
MMIVLSSFMFGCENHVFFGAETKVKAVENVKAVEEVKEIKVDNRDLINQQKAEEARKNQELLQNRIREYLLSSNISGAVSVVKNNQIIFNEGVGYANTEKQLLNQPSTTYPIGSISKVFVATSIMKLQEENKLNIQDPVSKYIPNFPNGNNIKLYNLLTHTSGIQPLRWQKGDTTPLQLVQEIEKLPIKFQAGEKWDYLDANYVVLGYILEKVTGSSLHEFIQKNIFDKVPMKDTGFMTHEHPVPYDSIGYSIKNGKVEKTQYFNTYALFACGDIYSTPYDLAQFDHALLTGQLVSKNSLNQMITPSPKSLYGLGLYYDGVAATSHGVLGGWHTYHAYYNDHTSVVVFLNQKNKETNIAQITDQIYQMVKSATIPEVSPPKY